MLSSWDTHQIPPLDPYWNFGSKKIYNFDTIIDFDDWSYALTYILDQH